MKIKNNPTFLLISGYFMVIIGAAVYAMGIQLFYRPVQLVSGGVTGIAMVINLVTDLPVGVMIIVMNIPLFMVALKKYGFKFMLGSLVGMIASSIFIDLFAFIDFRLTDDPLLSAIYGGLATGLGSGIIYSSGGTSGGIDVVAKFIREKYPYVNFGTFILIIDAAVVISYALIFRAYEKAMYTVLAVFIASKVIDTVLYGVSLSKLCFIISEHSEEIQTEIVKTLHRGVTMINGKGAYSGLDKQVLLCVVKRQQIVEIRRLIRGIDQQSFVIVTDTRDVFGKGFGNILVEK